MGGDINGWTSFPFVITTIQIHSLLAFFGAPSDTGTEIRDCRFLPWHWQRPTSHEGWQPKRHARKRDKDGEPEEVGNNERYDPLEYLSDRYVLRQDGF